MEFVGRPPQNGLRMAPTNPGQSEPAVASTSEFFHRATLEHSSDFSLEWHGGSLAKKPMDMQSGSHRHCTYIGEGCKNAGGSQPQLIWINKALMGPYEG